MKDSAYRDDDFVSAIKSVKAFTGTDLTQTLVTVEAAIRGNTALNCLRTLEECGAESAVLDAASLIKHLAGQVNVVIHALGILLCLPKILSPTEVIDYVSLGAGNTGRPFDLETNERIAEFKFIQWQGGAETIRQNALFKDFYLMAERQTAKRKYLYVLGSVYPQKFLNGGRAISSVLSRNVKLRSQFIERFGDQYPRVRDYYQPRKSAVVIEDVLPFVPELASITIDEPEET